MFKVECPGCKAPYQVDERRVPTSGLKMRCPKCGTSFQVDPLSPAPSGSSTPQPSPRAPLPAERAALEGSSGASAAKPPTPPRRGAPKPTSLGIGSTGFAKDGFSSSQAAPPARPLPPRPAPSRASAGVAEAESAFRQAPLAPPAADLPAVRGNSSVPPLNLDLPGEPSADLPATRSAPRAGTVRPLTLEVDDDLPAALGRAAPTKPGSGEFDLPAAVQEASPPRPQEGGWAAQGGELDLPSLSDEGVGESGFGRVGLPEAGVGLPAVSGAALPSPATAGLPARAGVELPSLSDAALPEISSLDDPLVGLPGLGGGLPEVAGREQHLPDVTSADQYLPNLTPPERHLPQAQSAAPRAASDGAPAGASDPFEVDLPPPAEEPFGAVEASFGAVEASFGAVEASFGEGSFDPFAQSPPAQESFGAEAQGFGAAAPAPDAPSPDESEAEAASLVRQAGGGVSYGEVDLEGDEAPLPFAAEGGPTSADDMEFGAVPQEEAPRATGTGVVAQAPIAVGVGPALAPAEAPKKSRRALKVAFSVLVVLSVGGGALALVPRVGPFGMYWIDDRLNRAAHLRLVDNTVKAVRTDFGQDAYPAAKRALEKLAKAQEEAPRLKQLAAYAAFAGFAKALRFGPDPEATARSKVLLDGLAEEGTLAHLGVARAARAIFEGQLARARQSLESLSRRDKRNVDIAVLRGELELLARDHQAALAAWRHAATLEDTSRVAFGLARAELAAGDLSGAEREARAALAKNQNHVGAKIILARILASERRQEKDAVALLDKVISESRGASPHELAGAHTALGEIQLSRSRISHAEAAFSEALKIDPKAARALTGLGETLYRAGRYSDAHARFEAGIQADPDDLAARVGVAKSKLELEQLVDAGALMAKLRQDHPKAPSVAHWHGRVLEALGNRKEAEDAYRAALKHGGKRPEVVDSYVALSTLLSQEGRNEEAEKVLASARELLPGSPAIHKALGELALARGRYEQALTELRRALELDSEDVGTQFRLGVALRRNRQFEEASKVFDDVAQADRDYPGLALERGLLHEQSGRADEALKAYEAALAKAPDDPDLMLRVGCSKVAAGRVEQAEPLLRKVLEARPTSGEANHCLGRCLLLEGSRLAEALRLLERSVQIDPNRAEYWLYVGWAANESGNVAKAEQALAKALELDQGLADAYWQRGVLLGRQGAVKDAVKDLTRALSLRPSRFEAHAALADAYYDLGKEREALHHWQQAIAAQPDNAVWRFRFGKLLVANQRDGEAIENLEKAIVLADGQTPAPRWLWEAHHLLARALGLRAAAVPHWEAFLRLGPRDSPYRAEAITALRKLGKPWER